MTIAFGLIVSRFLHYLAAAVLCGAAAFPFYAVPALIMLTRRELEIAVSPRLRSMLLVSASWALVTAILWLGFTAASMSGSAATALDPSILWLVLTGSDFGRVWTVRILLAAALVLILLGEKLGRVRLSMVLIGAMLLLGSIAATGHAWADERGGLLHVLGDALHLVAAGIWIGALVVLFRLVRDLHPDVEVIEYALSRFSGIGTTVVTVLIVTGFINSWFLIGPQHVFEMFASAYGLVLALKLALFAMMLSFAALNRFRLTPALAQPDSASTLRLLKTSIALETLFGVLVLLAVGWLGTLAPPLAQ